MEVGLQLLDSGLQFFVLLPQPGHCLLLHQTVGAIGLEELHERKFPALVSVTGVVGWLSALGKYTDA